MLKGFTHARLACGCRITFREGVEGSPVTVVVDSKSPACTMPLHVRDLPVYDYREALQQVIDAARVALIGYWLYPLAPPRLSGIAAFADPTKESLELGGALSWFQPFRNEFAAMPSMHIGYTLLFALTLVMMLDSRRRWLALLWPATMLFVVMATANHWWLDGIVAVALLMVIRIVARAPIHAYLPIMMGAQIIGNARSSWSCVAP